MKGIWGRPLKDLSWEKTAPQPKKGLKGVFIIDRFRHSVKNDDPDGFPQKLILTIKPALVIWMVNVGV